MEEAKYFIPPQARPDVNDSLLRNAWEIAYLLDGFLKENYSEGQFINPVNMIDDDTDTGEKK